MNGTMHLKDLSPLKKEPIIEEEIVELEKEE
jgi:hypothetical protein